MCPSPSDCAEATELETAALAKQKDFVIAKREDEIEEIKTQMRRQANEFDDMMTTILEKLSKEVLVATAPKQLLSAGVPIMDELEQVNRDIQTRAVEK